MDQINHIPFGLKKDINEFVDVADVPKGRECGCICPSCNIPLIARQGKIKRWHFAHASRKINGIENECKYSFFVSVRAMAKQILESGFTLSTPECVDQLIEYHHGSQFVEPVYIANTGIITLDRVQKESLFENTMVDLCGEINGYPLIIYFSHPDRDVPEELSELKCQKCAVLEINLSITETLFFVKKTSYSHRFIDELTVFLKENTKDKKWVSHPRKSAAISKAKQNMNVRIASIPRQNYRCLMCDENWCGFKNIKPECPICHSPYACPTGLGRPEWLF